MAFTWATVVGLVLGGAVYVRVPFTALDQVQPWHVKARLLLERLELATYDFRARQLGAASERSDAVVLVTMDEETHTSARVSEDPQLAVHPWPRDVYGGVIEEALDEGAREVLVDSRFETLSPRACPTAKGEARTTCDDDALRARLEKRPNKAVLSWTWSMSPSRAPDRSLRPFLARVADAPNTDAAVPALQKILSVRAPAYLIPEGENSHVWLAAQSEARGQELAAQLGTRAAEVRPLGPDDGRYEVDTRWLTSHLSKVQVTGLDPKGLLRIRDLEGPAAPLLTRAAAYGSVTPVRDVDGVVRGFPLLVTEADEEGRLSILASAPLSAAMLHAGSSALKYEGGLLHIGDSVKVPMDPSGQLLIAWGAADAGRGERGSLKRAVSAWKLVANWKDAEANRGRQHENGLSTRAVVLSDGFDAQAPWVTPIGDVHQGAVLAEVLANILEGRGISRVEPRLDFYVTLGWAFAGGLLAVAWSALFRRSGWMGTLIALSVFSGLHLFAARQIFVNSGRWVAVAAPLLALALTFLASLGYASALERRLREFVTGALGSALNPRLLTGAERAVGLAKPERRELAVYFSDVEGLTALSTTLEPVLLVGLVRSFLERMTVVVNQTQGQLDKYLGDAVLAFWGAPVHQENPAVAACEAALRMQHEFRRIKPELDARAGQSLVLRAGLDVGETVVGEMGTHHRVNYTVMGEPVATSFRLEGLCRRYGVELLCGESVVELVKGAFVFREIDRVRMPRRNGPLKIYALIGRKQRIGSNEWLDRYHAAIELMHARKFTEAATALDTLARERDDALCRMHAARARAYAAAPPPESWDGHWPGPGLKGVDR